MSTYTENNLLKLFEGIYSGKNTDALDTHFPFFDLCSPGMPLPGPVFIKHAVDLGDTEPEFTGTGKCRRLVGYGPHLHYLYRRALYDDKFRLPVFHKGGWQHLRSMPGRQAAASAQARPFGPRPCRVMVVSKCPGEEELMHGRILVGRIFAPLTDALFQAGLSEQDIGSWYLTNVCKWGLIDNATTLPKAHIKECAILLEQEIRIVKPDFILCLGSDASKHLLGAEFGVQAMLGRVETRDFITNYDRDSAEVERHAVKIMAITHPASIARTPELYDDFAKQVATFVNLTNGGSLGGYEKGIKHVNIYTADHLQAVIDEIKSRDELWSDVIAVDCEWHGERPQDDGAYLRTVQFSARDKEAYTVVLRHQGGLPAFVPTLDAAREKLKQLLLTDESTNWRPRIGGHMLRADLPWLIDFGVDCRREYAPAERLADCRIAGGWDTSLMYHAVNESTSYRLTDMLLRMTQAPRYDIGLDSWKEDYCRKHKLKTKDLDGYGMCPSWVMYPESWERNYNYAAYDADCTRRIAIKHMQPLGDLDCDIFDQQSWEPYWIAHRASLGFLEMELAGVAIDRARLDELTALFSWGYSELLEDFRAKISWPEFNPNSSLHCIAFLFGENYAKKLNKDTNAMVTIKPEQALSLNLTPIKSTGKPPMLWEDVVKNNKVQSVSPSTDKEVLGILGHKHPLAMQLRDLKFIGQVLKFTLKAPTTDEAGQATTDDDGFFEYDGGLPSYINNDSRIRTHLSQLKETGRAASYRPNLQNQTKRREDDYRRIFGYTRMNAENAPEHKGDYKGLFKTPLYKYPLRSVFSTVPGSVLVEADFKGAELAMLAWVSGDANMIDHVSRNNLPASDPNYYDIHSRMAVAAFQLNCEPTKKGLEKIGRPAIRVAAKNVVFGVPYGRQAAAIQRQCKEEGVDITFAESQKLIEMYFELYPSVQDFLSECRRRSQNEGWICGCFGRRRRFTKTADKKIIGEQERQAQNFVIQNGVADAMNCAIYNFVKFRHLNPQFKFKLLMQIHDALLFEVPVSELREFMFGINGNEPILKKCMSTEVPIIPRYLDNLPMQVTAPYHFGFDAEVYLHWGVAPSADELLAVGVDRDLIGELAH
jgi:uracil-DNA glycosylase family 4